MLTRPPLKNVMENLMYASRKFVKLTSTTMLTSGKTAGLMMIVTMPMQEDVMIKTETEHQKSRTIIKMIPFPLEGEEGGITKSPRQLNFCCNRYHSFLSPRGLTAVHLANRSCRAHTLV